MFKYFIYTTLFACFASIFYNYQYFSYVINYFYCNTSNHQKIIFSSKELKQYNGIDRKELYLSLLGNVFDVTKGSKHYGPGQTYNIFIGRDASKNFVDGKFNVEDVSDDVISLRDTDLLSLNHWIKFYKREYKKVGKLIGKYYDKNGNLTPYGKEVRSLIRKAEKSKENYEILEKTFPPCNVEFDALKGSRVWCTKKSGGIERDWIGVPRQLYQAESQSFRCACINKQNQHLGNIKEYENCESDSPSCYIRNK